MYKLAATSFATTKPDAHRSKKNSWITLIKISAASGLDEMELVKIFLLYSQLSFHHQNQQLANRKCAGILRSRRLLKRKVKKGPTSTASEADNPRAPPASLGSSILLWSGSSESCHFSSCCYSASQQSPNYCQPLPAPRQARSRMVGPQPPH